MTYKLYFHRNRDDVAQRRRLLLQNADELILCELPINYNV